MNDGHEPAEPKLGSPPSTVALISVQSMGIMLQLVSLLYVGVDNITN